MAPESRIVLDRAVIVADPDGPAYLQHRIRDLAAYLAEITGSRLPVASALPEGSGLFIVVGTRLAEQVLEAPLPQELLGDEGFVIRSSAGEGRTLLVVAGARPAGTKFGLVGLMKRVRFDGARAYIEAPVDVTSRPAFARRGMHLNGWPIGYPHGFRRWRERDWKAYLDLLSCQGVNLFYLWPSMEIMPVPLSREDEEYLQECRRVVDYAQQQQGMEVWIMQCTNRVARDDCGVRDPRARPYWRPSQEDLDPSKPEHFRAIVQSREELYRILDNVDGVCNIDSDPGWLLGSPLDDYLAVLRACRELLDRHNVHGRQARFVDWMWTGWGLGPDRYFDPGHQAETIRRLGRELPEPWMLVSGRIEFLPLCRQQGFLGKTVLLPYGVIEYEPSYPATNVAIDGVREALERIVPFADELAGAMGNVQTPLLQLPHVDFYLDALWDPALRLRSEQQALLDTAARLYPEHAELVAAGWAALKQTDPGRVEAVARELGDLVEHDGLGRPGVYGRMLFPDHASVAVMLVAQLELRAAGERMLRDLAPATELGGAGELVERFLDAYLAWDAANGWHRLWGWGNPAWALGGLAADPRFAALAATLGQLLADEASVDSFFKNIVARLSARYGQQVVDEGCVQLFTQAIQRTRAPAVQT